MKKLVRGVSHFQNQVYKRDLFTRLAEGQSPHTLFITCSDSRIDPNLLTQTEPGEIFVLRNAGNLVPPHDPFGGGESATIEYAVSALSVSDIVVCGHSHCGAMKGLLDPQAVEQLPAVKKWLEYAAATRAILQSSYADRSGEELLNIAIQENVLVQLNQLKTLPAVAAGLVEGTLNLHGWVYKFETGEVFAFDGEEGQFVPLAKSTSSAKFVRRAEKLHPYGRQAGGTQ